MTIRILEVKLIQVHSILLGMNIFKQVARHEHFTECLLYIRYLIFRMSWQVFAHFMSEK